MNREVIEFGEASVGDSWYSHEHGTRIKCDENVIEHLWNQWIMNMTAHKDKEGEYVVYKVLKDFMKLPEQWIEENFSVEPDLEPEP